MTGYDKNVKTEETIKYLKAHNRFMWHFEVTKTPRSRLVFKGECFGPNEDHVKDYLRRNYSGTAHFLKLYAMNEEQIRARLNGEEIEL